jgi:peptide deformylase
MILPVVAYGSDILRKVAVDIDQNYPELSQLIENMWETMYYTKGVGLAAPQINQSIRLFIVDSEQFFLPDEDIDDEEPEEIEFNDAPGIKKVFINPKLIDVSGEKWTYKEGCLSIPKINEDVTRHETVTIEFFDQDFNKHTETYTGITARIILHEYDHIEGKLFIDYISPLKKKLLNSKLSNISKGKIDVFYRMSFPKK